MSGVSIENISKSTEKQKNSLNIFFITMEFLNNDNCTVVDGGTANTIYKQATYLTKLGHKVNILDVSAKKFKSFFFQGINVYRINPKKYCKILKTFMYPFSVKRQELNSKDYLYFKGIELFLNLHNLKEKIDIIQYTSDFALALLPPSNIPYCIRIASYYKHYAKEYSQPLNEKFLKLYSQAFKNAKFIYGPSKHIANIIKEDLNLESDIKIIETPFNAKEIEEDLKYYNEIPNKKYALFFGTLGNLKGCFDFGEIIYEILDKYQDLDFVFVGKQVPLNQVFPIDFIKEKAGKYKERVIYFDKMQHKYLYPIIKNAQFCLMPSRTENFSNTCLEAMSKRRIVLGTTPFFDQIITDKKSGFLCEAKNPISIKEKIDEIMSLTQQERNKIENSAYERVLQNSPDKIVNELLAYYNYVIENWNV